MRRIEDYRQSWRRNHKKEQNFISYLFWGISFSAIKKIRQNFLCNSHPCELWAGGNILLSTVPLKVVRCKMLSCHHNIFFTLFWIDNWTDKQTSKRVDESKTLVWPVVEVLDHAKHWQWKKETDKQKSWWFTHLSVACCGSTRLAPTGPTTDCSSGHHFLSFWFYYKSIMLSMISHHFDYYTIKTSQTLEQSDFVSELDAYWPAVADISIINAFRPLS